MNKIILILLVIIFIFSGCSYITGNSTNSNDAPIIFEEMIFSRNNDYGRTFEAEAAHPLYFNGESSGN